MCSCAALPVPNDSKQSNDLNQVAAPYMFIPRTEKILELLFAQSLNGFAPRLARIGCLPVVLQY